MEVPIGMALRQCVYATFRVLISRRVWMFTQLTTLLLLLILVLLAFEKNTELPLYKRDMEGFPTRRRPPMPHIDEGELTGYGRLRDNCSTYIRAGRMAREVYYDVLRKRDVINEGDITLVTQLTSSRVEKLYNLILRWPGPISVAVYVERSITASSLREELRIKLSSRNNIALHLVAEKGAFFPVNFLRNIAMETANTKYIFLNDVDFEPMPRLEDHLKRYISKGYLQGKTALVVPAFEAIFANVTIPDNKADLLKLWSNEKTIRPFHFGLDKNGKEVASTPHEPTSYPQWKKATKPYYAYWADYYEPYVVTERAITPKYWTAFVGRFYNKASHLSELFAMGFDFVVLPDVFIVHTPHEPANFTVLEYRCGRRESARFRMHIMDKYGFQLPIRLHVA